MESIVFLPTKLKEILLIHFPRGHCLVIIPLTRSQNDPGLKIGVEFIVFLSTNQKNWINPFSKRSLFGNHTADKEPNDPVFTLGGWSTKKLLYILGLCLFVMRLIYNLCLGMYFLNLLSFTQQFGARDLGIVLGWTAKQRWQPPRVVTVTIRRI